MLRTRIRIGIVAALVAAAGSLAVAPAHATRCHPNPLGDDVSGEEQVCYKVVGALCTVGTTLGGGCPVE